VTARRLDFSALGGALRGAFAAAPGVGCMLGPLSAVAKPRKASTRAPRAALAAVVTAVEAAAGAAGGGEGGDKQETDRQMEGLFRALLRLGGAPCTVLRAMLNPASFGQTVENLFALSFLVRDQRVRMFHDADGALAVAALSTADQKAAAAERKVAAASRAPREGTQLVLGLSQEDWQVMRNVLTADEVLLPHRPEAGGGGGGGD
jgi:hypothetical protein